MLSVIILFSCDENATCIDADDFGDLQREIIEVNSSDTFKCTVRPDYRAGSVYDDAKLSDTNKVNPTLKECLTTNTHINAINTNAEEMRAILGVTATNPNLKGCQDYLAEEILIDPIKKDYIDYCETFCENLCNAQSIGNSESPWIANTPRKENSDIGVNITPGSKISVIIQEGIISLPVEVSSPLISLAFDPHNFTPNDINFTTSISTGTRYDVIFGGDYFDDRSSSSPYVGCGKSPTYTRFSNVVNNNKIIYNSSCGASAINSFTEDSLIFARRNIIYFEPFPNQNDIINVPIHANPALWSCSENFPNNKAKIKCDKGSDSYAQDGKIIGTDGAASEKNIIKNGGFIRANDEVFVIKDEIIKNIPASSTTPIIFSTNDLGNSGVDVFVNLKSDCGLATAQIQVIDSAIPPNIYYQDNNLTLSNDYNPKNIPVYKGKALKVTFSSVANECSITAKSQKYLDIPIEASGEAEFQMKDLSAISYDDIPNFDATNQSLLKDYFQCLPANPFIQNFYFNISNSSKVVGMGANCNGSTPLNLNTNSGQQYLGSVPVGNSFTPVSNPEGFTKIQIFRDDSGVKDIILFIKDDDFIPTESSISLSSLSLTATFDTSNLDNANNDVFVNLKSNCGSGGSVVTAKIQVIDSSAISPGILYQNNNLALSNSYNPQIIQVPKGKKLIAIFTSLTSVCQITAKSQKYPAILASDKSTIFDSTNSYNCDSDPNCQELSCNGGRISGIKAQYDASSIKALSIICSENYVPVPTATPENSCTLYGRIMNPDNNVAYDVKNKVEINSGHDEFKIISYDKVKTLAAPSGGSTLVPTFSSITGGKYVKRAYLGLQTYANSTKKSLTDPECKIPLDIANCSIGSAVSACSIYNSDVKKSWLYDCYNGDGLNGIKETSKAGTGGAGGGNNSKATRIKNGYTNDSAQAGKNGESYVNPEFGTIVVTDYADNASKGKGGVAGTTSGSEGYLDLSYDDSTWSSLQTISGNTETEITSVNGQKIYYRIKGGGGGAGGSCSGTNGGNGANGDSFSGSFTLPSGTWTLKVKIGQGGGAGANCSASPSSASNSDSPNFFKGGSGGAVDSTGGGGGAGGSASYIAVVRSDEAHDSYTASGATTYRQDFLVIAGGGGGGGGATSQNLGIKAKSPIASPTDKSTQETRKITYDLNSNA